MASKTKGGAASAAKPPKAKKSNAKKDRAKKGASAAAGTKPVQRPAPPQEQVRKMWGGKPLRDFADACLTARKRASAASGAVGKLISAKAKTTGLDASSFNLALRIYKEAKADPQNGRVKYDNLQFYLSELKIEELIGDSLFRIGEIHSTRGDDADETESDDSADANETDGDNVHEFPGGEERSVA